MSLQPAGNLAELPACYTGYGSNSLFGLQSSFLNTQLLHIALLNHYIQAEHKKEAVWLRLTMTTGRTPTYSDIKCLYTLNEAYNKCTIQWMYVLFWWWVFGACHLPACVVRVCMTEHVQRIMPDQCENLWRAGRPRLSGPSLTHTRAHTHTI